MQRHGGRWRWVITLPSLGIVLKFPRFYPRRFLRSVFDLFDTLNRGVPWSLLRQAELHEESAVIRFGFGGWLDNLGEWWFWSTTHHPFLQPTYLTLFGLVNIQQYGPPLTEDQELEHERLARWGRMTDWEVYQDGHTFGSNANFCRDADGLIRIVDYGQGKTRRVLQKWADSLLLGFRTTLRRSDA